MLLLLGVNGCGGYGGCDVNGLRWCSWYVCGYTRGDRVVSVFCVDKRNNIERNDTGKCGTMYITDSNSSDFVH